MEATTQGNNGGRRPAGDVRPVPDNEPDADFDAALGHAQAEMESAALDRTNPHFGNRYATLASILAVCKPALNKHGFVLLQRSDTDPVAGTIGIETAVRRGGMELSFGWVRLKAQQNTPQGIGSADTYARRYSLQTAFAIAAEDDDDGEVAEGRKTQTPPARQAAKPAAPSVPAATVLPPRAPSPAPARAAKPAAPPTAGEPPDFVMQVGKHKGCKASEVPVGYLEWYADAKSNDPSKWEGKAWEQRTRDEIAFCRYRAARHAEEKATPAPAADEPPPPDAPGEFDDDPNVPF